MRVSNEFQAKSLFVDSSIRNGSFGEWEEIRSWFFGLSCALNFEKESERETEGEGDREEEGKRGKY